MHLANFSFKSLPKSWCAFPSAARVTGTTSLTGTLLCQNAFPLDHVVLEDRVKSFHPCFLLQS